MNKEEIKEFLNNLDKSTKPIMIVSKLKTVAELTNEQIQHFKENYYIWQVSSIKDERFSGMYLGILLNDSYQFIQAIVASEEVKEYILNLSN